MSYLKLYTEGSGLKARYKFLKAVYESSLLTGKHSTAARRGIIGKLLDMKFLDSLQCVSTTTLGILESFVKLGEGKLDKAGKLQLISKLKFLIGTNPNVPYLSTIDKAKATVVFSVIINVSDGLIESLYGKNNQVLKNIGR